MGYRERRGVALRDGWGRRLGTAAAMGLVSGLVCVLARRGLEALQWVWTQHAGLLAHAAAALPVGRRAMTPALGALAATLVLAAGHRWGGRLRSVDYVEAIRRREAIPGGSAAVRFLSSACSIATGATIGREGSMIQLAIAAVSGVAERGPGWWSGRQRHLLYGLAAAVGSVYKAPLAGVFFALEIGLGRLAWAEALPLLVASGLGWMCSRTLLGVGPLFPLAGVTVSWQAVLPLVLLTLLGAVLAPGYYRLLHGAEVLKRLPAPLLWSGALVGGLSVLTPQVWGNGDAGLLALTHGAWAWRMVVAMMLLRLMASAACVGTGAIGGVFTPTIFLGGGLGALAAAVLPGASAGLAVVLGIACLLAGVTHAPLMSALMAAELTGHYGLVPLLLPACVVAAWGSRRLEPNGLYGVATENPAGKERDAGARQRG